MARDKNNFETREVYGSRGLPAASSRRIRNVTNDSQRRAHLADTCKVVIRSDYAVSWRHIMSAGWKRTRHRRDSVKDANKHPSALTSD